MNNRFLILFGLGMMGLAGFFFYKNLSQNQPLTQEVFPQLSFAKTFKIRIESSAGSLVFLKEKEGWQMQVPKNFPMNAAKLFDFFEEIKKIKTVRLISENEKNYEDLGVADWKGQSQPSKDSTWIFLDDSSQGIVFGKLREASPTLVGGQYFRRLGEKAVYLADRPIQFNSNPNFWVLRELFLLDVKSIEGVNFSSPHTHWSAERIKDGTENHWLFQPTEKKEMQGQLVSFLNHFHPFQIEGVEKMPPSLPGKPIQINLRTNRGDLFLHFYPAGEEKDKSKIFRLQFDATNFSFDHQNLAQNLKGQWLIPSQPLMNLVQTFDQEKK